MMMKLPSIWTAKEETDITLALGAGFADLSSFDLTISQVESNAADVTFEFPVLPMEPTSEAAMR
jgi:hypothetical protein